MAGDLGLYMSGKYGHNPQLYNSGDFAKEERATNSILNKDDDFQHKYKIYEVRFLFYSNILIKKMNTICK